LSSTEFGSAPGPPSRACKFIFIPIKSKLTYVSQVQNEKAASETLRDCGNGEVCGKRKRRGVSRLKIMDIELLQERARIIRSTRKFFDDRNYLELDTPLISPDLIPETCLEIFTTKYCPPMNSAKNTAQELYLIPSPEIWMKKIIAEKQISVYQICKCFRNCESIGKTHSPEFTMLEYYTMDADYMDSLNITEALFAALLSDENLNQFHHERPLHTEGEGRKCLRHCLRRNEKELAELSPPFLRLTMEQAFEQFAGFSLIEAIESGTLEEHAHKLGIYPPAGTSDADLYNLIFVHSVEPNLPQNKPVALLDYPAIVPCLAQLNVDCNKAALTRQRWELYLRGLEIANCYSEERDAEQVKKYFLDEGKLKNKNALLKHNIDNNYWKIFCSFPRCSGVALGMDRLIMALTGRKSIDAVLPFLWK
jgi:lysyl-tRNA synthetase class 2